MTEILTGIRVIKFYAWEQNFANRVNQIRYEYGFKMLICVVMLHV